MGDIAIASAVFEDIHRAFPDREIHLNTLPPWDRLFAHDPRFQRVFAVDVRARRRGMKNMARWLREVMTGNYDLVIDLQTTDRSRVLLSLLWLSGRQIHYRVGNKRVFPYNIAPTRKAGTGHALEVVRATLGAAGIPAKTERPLLHYSSENRRHADALMREHGLREREYAVFLPGSQAAGYLKRWGAKRYAELGRYLKENGINHIVILGGPDERDECRSIASLCRPWAVNLCGQTDFLDIIPICEGARFVVGNDTGTAHVASAVAIPIVVICGPTDPRRVRPAGNNVVAMQADLPCINCYRKTCSHHSCMKSITPKMVLDKLPLD